MIELIHVKKQYPESTPLKDVNTVINSGDIISVIGPSGTGKSTLLRCINMLDPPTEGKILLDGMDITAEGCDLKSVRRRLGMVFQSFNLFGHMTIIENVMAPQIDLLGRSRQEAYDKGIALLKRVGMDGRALQYSEQLSGGQKQRVAIARTLSMDPEIILFDEPTSALDPTMVGEVESVIRDLANSGTTMMIVTHEMRFAREICNRVFYMDQGGIYEDGTPEQIFDNPQKDRTRRFIRQLKVLELNFTSTSFDFPGTSGEVENYCVKAGMSHRKALHIRAAYEELCAGILIPKLSESAVSLPVRFIFEYDPNNEATAIEVLYGGPSFSPEQSENILSLQLLKKEAKDIKHEQTEEDGYTNRLTMSIL